MRIELNDENTERILEAERQLKEKYNVHVGPTELINIIFGAIDTVDLQQLVRLTLRGKSDDPTNSPRRTIRKKTNWIFGFK